MPCLVVYFLSPAPENLLTYSLCVCVCVYVCINTYIYVLHRKYYRTSWYTYRGWQSTVSYDNNSLLGYGDTYLQSFMYKETTAQPIDNNQSLKDFMWYWATPTDIGQTPHLCTHSYSPCWPHLVGCGHRTVHVLNANCIERTTPENLWTRMRYYATYTCVWTCGIKIFHCSKRHTRNSCTGKS